MVMSNKPVSIDPANAGEDETKPEVELVTKRQTITPVWKYFGLEANKKGKPRLPDRHVSTRSGSEGWKHFQSLQPFEQSAS